MRKKNPFNLFTWKDLVAVNPLRPNMECVHYENGYATATDSHILVHVKHPYNPIFEGKNVNPKTNDIVDKDYIKWESLIPAKDSKDWHNISNTSWHVDAEMFYDSAKKTFSKKMLAYQQIRLRFVRNTGEEYDSIVSIELLAKIVAHMDSRYMQVHIPADFDRSKMVAFKNIGNDNAYLIMPRLCSNTTIAENGGDLIVSHKRINEHEYEWFVNIPTITINID